MGTAFFREVERYGFLVKLLKSQCRVRRRHLSVESEKSGFRF